MERVSALVLDGGDYDEKKSSCDSMLDMGARYDAYATRMMATDPSGTWLFVAMRLNPTRVIRIRVGGQNDTSMTRDGWAETTSRWGSEYRCEVGLVFAGGSVHVPSGFFTAQLAKVDVLTP
jgi:hypothetical protein